MSTPIIIGYTLGSEGRYIAEIGQVGIISSQKIFESVEAAEAYFKKQFVEMPLGHMIVKVTVETL